VPYPQILDMMNKKELGNNTIKSINNLKVTESELPLNCAATTSINSFNRMIPEPFNIQLISEISKNSSNKISEENEEDILNDISTNSNTLAIEMDIDENSFITTKLEKNKIFPIQEGKNDSNESIDINKEDNKNITKIDKKSISSPTTIVDLDINSLNKPDFDFSNLLNFSETKIAFLNDDNKRKNNSMANLLPSNSSSLSPKIIKNFQNNINNNNNKLIIA